jgi:sugar phosphate isomerase/epimerase
MIHLSGFADEIDAKPEVQIETLLSEGIRHLELRAAWGKNSLDLSADERRELRRQLTDAGMGVSAIASPIGKVRLDESWPAHMDRFRVALDVAEYFGAPFIRLFSYYAATGRSIDDQGDEVMRRLSEQVEAARGRPVRLLHENEKEIYGSTAPHCLEIARRAAGMDLIFDPANYVQVGTRPIEAWGLLKEHVVYFHIKDALMGSGNVVMAGTGDGNIPEILRDAVVGRGYQGFISLEPHLAVAGHSSGFSGPDLFKKAAQTLKGFLDQMGAKYE